MKCPACRCPWPLTFRAYWRPSPAGYRCEGCGCTFQHRPSLTWVLLNTFATLATLIPITLWTLPYPKAIGLLALAGAMLGVLMPLDWLAKARLRRLERL